MSESAYFKINNCVFAYCKHSYNFAYNNERTVEVPLGEFFINNFGYGITEVGSVMSYYNFNCGEVIPIQEANKADFTNKNVLSIGAVCFDREIYKKIIAESKNYLITWAIGFDKELDEYVNQSNISKLSMKRISLDNKWIKEDICDFSHKYNEPYNNANGICCVTNMDVLL